MKNYLLMQLGVCLMALPVSLADAQDEVDISATFAAAIDSLGGEIVKYVETQDSTSRVAIGTFVGPSPSSSNAGARIVVALQKRIGKDLKIADSGAYNISGQFRGQKLDDKFVTVIEAAIKDALGNQIHRLRKKVITDEEEGIAFFGPSSLDLTPATGTVLASKTNKTDQIINSIVKPDVHVTGTIARTASKSPYGIELQIKRTDGGYESLPLTSDGRISQVGLGERDVYAIRIYNDSLRPVGVKLTIDGINVFALSQNPSYNGQDITMALCPCSKSRIKGWHLTDSKSAEFQVARFGETAAARFGAFEKMGTITARFFDAIPNGKINCPPCSGQTRSLGTKVGKETKMDYGRLDVRFGDLLGAVSTRYVKQELPSDLPPE